MIRHPAGVQLTSLDGGLGAPYPLHRHELAVGRQDRAGGAALGGAGAAGLVLRVNPEWTTTAPPPPVVLATAAVVPLAGPAVLAVATGADLREVRTHLDLTCAGYPPGMTPPGACTGSSRRVVQDTPLTAKIFR